MKRIRSKINDPGILQLLGWANLCDTTCDLLSHGHCIHITLSYFALPPTSQRWSKLSCVLPACIYSDIAKNLKFSNKNWGKNKKKCLQQMILTGVKSGDFCHKWMVLVLCSPGIHHLSVIHEKIRIASWDSIQWLCHIKLSKNEMWPQNQPQFLHLLQQSAIWDSHMWYLIEQVTRYVGQNYCSQISKTISWWSPLEFVFKWCTAKVIKLIIASVYDGLGKGQGFSKQWNLPCQSFPFQ